MSSLRAACRSAQAAAATLRRAPAVASPLAPRPTAARSDRGRRPILAAAAAAATAAAFTPVSPAHAQPLISLSPTPESSRPYQSSPILCDIARADPRATQTLLSLLADPKQHESLLQSGAVQALLDGLESVGPDASPVRLALVRALADLAAGATSAHPALQEPSLSRALASLLSTAADAATESWSSWLRRQTGMADPTPSDVPDLAAGQSFHVARAAAALSRHADLHPALLADPNLLPALCRALHAHSSPPALASAEAADTLRSLVAAVSALAKSASSTVVSSGVHKLLLRFAGDSSDSGLQTYAAAGIRNLVRHPTEDSSERWHVHREIVVAGLPDALTKALAAPVAQTRAFAAAAFADIMTSGHRKAHLIRARLVPAYAPFAKLLVDRDPVVSRAMSRALPVLSSPLSTDDDNSKAKYCITPDLAAALANASGPLINGAIGRGELPALRMVRAICVSEELARGMVDKGLMEVLIKGVDRARGPFWEECMATLAVLSESLDITKLAVERGLLRKVLARPCYEHNALQTTAFLARVARIPEHRVEIAHRALQVILSALTARENPEAVREGARALYNLSLGGVSKLMVSLRGGLIPLIRVVRSDDAKARTLAVATLAELSESIELATKLVEADAVSSLMRAVAADEGLTRDVARCLAQLSQVAEVHGALASAGVADWMADLVKRNGGKGKHAPDTMHYATLAVSNIAFSPGMARKAVQESGVSRTLVVLSASNMGSPFVVHCAKQAMRNLRGEEGVALLPSDGAPKSSEPA